MSSSGRCFGNGRNGRPQASSFVQLYAERGLPSVRAITGAFDHHYELLRPLKSVAR
ncbi:MAG: hypothetical protein JO187_02315 [Acidobacteria bacterium]|nr:hypothetical protein [Acidobacteriota bacterium]